MLKELFIKFFKLMILCKFMSYKLWLFFFVFSKLVSIWYNNFKCSIIKINSKM